MLKSHSLILLFSAFGLALLSGSPALADGDAAVGKKVFNRCQACHTLTGGAKKMGPPLECVIGREVGSVPGYKYSKAMKESSLIWTETTLEEYLVNPRKYLPGTKMAFAGLKNPEQIQNLMAFLAQATVTPVCPK